MLLEIRKRSHHTKENNKITLAQVSPITSKRETS